MDKETGLTDKQKNLLDRIKYEGHKIGHLVGYTDLTEFHSKLINEIVCGKESASYCIHRCAYTSSTICLGIALHILTKPNKKILLMVQNKGIAQMRLEIIKKILESKEIQALSYILYNKGFTVEIINRCLIISLDSLTCQLVCVGADKEELAGGHEKDLYILDGILGLEDCYYETVRAKHLDIYNRINKFEGRNILFDHSWCYDDLFKHIKGNYIYDCYDTGLLSEERINEIKLAITPSLFSAQYLCNPYKEIYTKGNQAKLEKLASKMYRLSLKNEDISDIRTEMQEIIDNCEIIYRYDNRRKL